jgi:heme/copper-type cytochrome/quinol oxidase subunit 2
MKTALRIIAVLLIAALALLAANVRAGELTMTEREDVQIISWSVEFLAIFIALAIAVFVWRLSKRDRKRRNEQQQDIKPD